MNAICRSGSSQQLVESVPLSSTKRFLNLELKFVSNSVFYVDFYTVYKRLNGIKTCKGAREIADDITLFGRPSTFSTHKSMKTRTKCYSSKHSCLLGYVW